MLCNGLDSDWMEMLYRCCCVVVVVRCGACESESECRQNVVVLYYFFYE